MIYIGGALYVLALLAGWVLNLVGLPGNWLMVAAAALCAWLAPPDSRLHLEWLTVVLLAVVGLAGEAAEFAAGAAGAARKGGSKRGMVLSALLAVVGGLAGAVVGTPIPIIGNAVAAVLGAALGSAAGAVLGERWKGRELNQSLQIGEAAFWGRLLGTLAKTVAGTVILATALAAAVV
ncbi:MAG: DUF456 family protein [Pirellulales bacterium]|nr:DUF456 family protein [Pirellulales bacterium]